MESYLAPIYGWARSRSRQGIVVVALLVALLSIFTREISISIQLVVALISLFIGIPHGAIDHLVAIPSKPRSRFVAYILIYFAIAVVAGWLIATWNVTGFRVVLVMSSLHFGFGDASYVNEYRDQIGKKRNSPMFDLIYALPAGFMPVILPLTDSRTLSALNRINPALNHWAGLHTSMIRSTTLWASLIAGLLLIARGKLSMAVDLALLAMISISAPPLIAFAAYFGLWHALRHTARLVPKYGRANQSAESGQWRRAIRQTFRAGSFAIFGTVIVAVGLMVASPGKFSSSLLWSTLVIIWALTVPHMATTARFDLRALKKS